MSNLSSDTSASEQSICESLVDEARDLITYSPVLDEDKKKPKSKEVMGKNKKGFEKLKKAVSMKCCGWMTHYNIAEFYYNGLDGATNVDETKAVYHYFKAWRLYGNQTIIAETKSSPFSEPILINFCGLIDKIQYKVNTDNKDDENNNFIIDLNQVIKFCQSLEEKAQYISYKILSVAIHGRILHKLQNNNKESRKYYEKCISLREGYKSRISGHVLNVVEGIKIELKEMVIPTDNNDLKQCAFCNKQLHKLLRCGRCKKVYYCSVQCQKPHWKIHKKICKKET